MWRISPIAEDWVVKGCHIHISQIELAVRPDQNGHIIFRKVFSSTSDMDFDVASRVATGLLADPEFRQKLRGTVARAMSHMKGITGHKRSMARGRLREFNFLLIGLDRLEVS